MSSADEDFQDGNNAPGSMHGSKKRRVQRACDICRRKKIRCDGGQMPGNKCSNCIAYHYDCTYVEAAKKRGPPKGYVEGLENRLEKMESLLSKLCPGSDFTQELGGDKNTWLQTMEAPTMGQSSSPSALHLHGIKTPTFDDDGIAPQCSDDDDLEDFAKIHIADTTGKDVEQDAMNFRFFGKSSGVVLVQTAIDLKNEFSGLPLSRLSRKPMFTSKRPEFWSTRPWELVDVKTEHSNYEFPDDDLMTALIDLYFTRVNLFMPLLHRPTFDKGIAKGYHRQSSDFGGTVLLACAIGSRHSADPRVFLPGANSEHSAGWKWFDQVQMVRKARLAPPTIYDLQNYSLSVIFLQGSSVPQASWTLVGVGVRMAQDVGAHRRKMYTTGAVVEDELWKRAFWCLVTLDRYLSQILGRPCAIQDEDFDLDLPTECDDEYWEDPDPEKAFKQPPGKPSKVSFFISYLKLNQILGFALRTIYSINKSKVRLGFVGQEWEQHIVAELDSALNKWIDAVPDHLRWDPNREDQQFFSQSAFLHASYYHLQILIHRPFIPSPRKPSPLSFPSLAICTNAARSCSHVVDIHFRRMGVPLPQLQTVAFTAGIVLLLNIWGGKRSGIPIDPAKEMEDVHKCMQVLKAGEKRFHSNGRLWDVLCELASAGDFPLPQPSPIANNKRERDSDSPISGSSVTASSSSSPGVADGPRAIAGSRRVSKEAKIPPATNSAMTLHSDMSSTFTLPMHSDELARLPLHGQMAFASNNNPTMDATDHFLYSTLGNTTAAIPGQPSLTNAVSGPDTVNPGSTAAFPMDHLFYEQMGNIMSSSSNEHQGASQGLEQFGGVNQQLHSLTSNQQLQSQALMDCDTIAMWSNAPTGFELDDWGTYMSELSREQRYPVQQPGY